MTNIQYKLNKINPFQYFCTRFHCTWTSFTYIIFYTKISNILDPRFDIIISQGIDIEHTLPYFRQILLSVESFQTV